MARAYSQDLRDRVIDAALAERLRGRRQRVLGLAMQRRSSGCAGHAREVNGPHASRGSRGAASLIRIVITFSV